MKEIPLSNTFKEIQMITKGMSRDKKYLITTDHEEHLLLRISDIKELDKKKKEYDLMQKLSSLHIPMSQPIDFGICNNNSQVYTLLSWIDGDEVESVIPKLSPQEQYRIGRDAGSILRRIHTLKPTEPMENWETRYFAVIDKRLEAFHQEGEKFTGYEILINFIENNRDLLKQRPQTYHHGDYHMGNLILSDDKKVSVIDWHTVDFNNIGDPWYDFSSIGVEYPYFASGQIDGYFDDNIPDEFWALLAYYLSVSAITSIVWAKYFAVDRLSEILNLNTNILKWFQNMHSMVPTWYKQCK